MGQESFQGHKRSEGGQRLYNEYYTVKEAQQ